MQLVLQMSDRCLSSFLIQNVISKIYLFWLLVPQNLLTISFCSLLSHVHSLVLKSVAVAGVSKNVGHIQSSHSEFDVITSQIVPLTVPHDFLGLLDDLMNLVVRSANKVLRASFSIYSCSIPNPSRKVFNKIGYSKMSIFLFYYNMFSFEIKFE